MPGEQDTIVYEITDYTISLIHASEMMSQGYHVTTLVFTRVKPRTLPEAVRQPQEMPLLGVI
jgi:hypothetical protein